jgi:hypothetical protein
MGARASRLGAAALALALAGPAAASAAEGERHPALLDHVKVQLAGNVGFVSPGVGWAWLGRRLEGDLFLGWVPERFGGDVFSLTAKLAWTPWILRDSGWIVRPAYAAAQLTYTFGDRYFVRLPDRYPDEYYHLPTALRGALALGISAGKPVLGLDELGAYLELVALDAALVAWTRNPTVLGPAEVFSLALGIRAAF